MTLDVGKRTALQILVILGGHRPNLPDSIKTGKSLSNLCADGCDLHQWRNHQAGEHEIHDEVTQGHLSGDDRLTTDLNHDDADHPNDDGRKRRNEGNTGNRPGHVTEKLVSTLGKRIVFAPFGGVRLDNANAGKTFREPPGDLCVDLASLTKNGTQVGKGVGHHSCECRQHYQRDERETPVEVEQHYHGNRRGDEPSGQLDQAGADQVANALGVGHDARDQYAGLRGIEVRHRKSRYVLLHQLAHFGDCALCRHAQHLCQTERRACLDQRSGTNP